MNLMDEHIADASVVIAPFKHCPSLCKKSIVFFLFRLQFITILMPIIRLFVRRVLTSGLSLFRNESS